MSAIQVSLAYVQAQNKYALLNPDGLGPHVYARHIVSSPGKKDGALLADCRGAKSQARSVNSRHRLPAKGTNRPEANSLSRLLLPHPEAPGCERVGRRL